MGFGISQGTAKRCCIIEPPVSPWRRAGWEFYRTALSERRGGLEFGWEAKPETDTFGHEPALVARTCSPAKLLGLLKFVGTPRYNDARRCHPFAWHSQAAPAAMAYRRTSEQPRRVGAYHTGRSKEERRWRAASATR